MPRQSSDVKKVSEPSYSKVNHSTSPAKQYIEPISRNEKLIKRSQSKSYVGRSYTGKKQKFRAADSANITRKPSR